MKLKSADLGQIQMKSNKKFNTFEIIFQAVLCTIN